MVAFVLLVPERSMVRARLLPIDRRSLYT